MGEALVGLAVFGFFAAVTVLLVWQGARNRRRSRGGVDAVVGPLQEIWHPTAYRPPRGRDRRAADGAQPLA